jgi:hypothetical protein
MSEPAASAGLNPFKKAVKRESKLRLSVSGPSGSGKTYTSLAIATGLGGKIAVIDTERGSASKYADLFEFDVLNLEPPYHPDRFLSAILAAEKAGYEICIIDSLSHAWVGPGGVLEIVDEESRKTKGNTYVAWSKGTPLQNKLVDGITRSKMHVIGTMRSKTEYTLEQGPNGKSTPKKVGMAPIQRDGFEYEFDIGFEMTLDNEAIVTKSRCFALSGRIFSQPGANVAEILKTWLSGDASVPVRQRFLDAMNASAAFSTNEERGAWIKAQTGKTGRELSDAEMEALLAIVPATKTSEPEHIVLWRQAVEKAGLDIKVAFWWCSEKFGFSPNIAETNPDQVATATSAIEQLDQDEINFILDDYRGEEALV